MKMQDKKTTILNVAEELFSTKGFEAASVREIAEAAKVNVAMISYYFGSKENLMLHLFKYRMDASKLKIENIIKDNSLKPFEKVEKLLGDYITKVINNQAFYKIMVSEQVLRQNPAIIKQISELKKGYADLTTELLKEGQAQKLFKKEVDVFMMMNTMTGTVTQIVINQEIYFDFHNYARLTATEKKEILYKNLYAHLRNIFKATLGYTENKL